MRELEEWNENLKAKQDAEHNAMRPEEVQAGRLQHELIGLLERARQIKPEPFKVTNNIRQSQNRVCACIYRFVYACDCHDECVCESPFHVESNDHTTWLVNR